MARSRYIKPEFFKDEDLARVSHAARLLFVGLWSLADRVGRLEDRPLRIKAELFPYEALDVEPLLAELATMKAYGNGAFIQRYEVGGRSYIQIANFTKHQKCHPKEPDSGLPEPAAARNGKPRQETANPPESVTESVTESVGFASLPADVQGERLLHQSRVARERKFYALIQRLSELQPEKDPPDIAREVTCYTSKDGRQVKGVVRPEGMSEERLDRSLEDAQWWIDDLEAKRGTKPSAAV